MSDHTPAAPPPPASTPPGVDTGLADALQRELDPGERLVWSGRPRPDLALRSALANAWLLLLLGVLLGAFMIAAAVRLWIRPVEVPIEPGAAGLSILIILMGVALITWILSEPSRVASRARRTIYAITDRRALVITRSRRGVVEERDFAPDETRHILRVERPDGSGDIIFESPRRNPSGSANSVSTLGRIGFLSVEDCAAVERILRTTLQQPPERP